MGGFVSGAGELGGEKKEWVMFALLWQTQMGKEAAGGVVFILCTRFLSLSFFQSVEDCLGLKGGPD